MAQPQQQLLGAIAIGAADLELEGVAQGGERQDPAFQQGQGPGLQAQAGLVGHSTHLQVGAEAHAGAGNRGVAAGPFRGDRCEGDLHLAGDLTQGPQAPSVQLVDLVVATSCPGLAAAVPEAEAVIGRELEGQTLGAVLVPQARLAHQLAEQDRTVFLDAAALQPQQRGIRHRGHGEEAGGQGGAHHAAIGADLGGHQLQGAAATPLVGAGQHQPVGLLLQVLPGEQPVPPLILHPQVGDHRLRQSHQPHQHRIRSDALAVDRRLNRRAANRQAGAIAVFRHGHARLDREGGGLGHGGRQGNAQAHVVEGGPGITGVGRCRNGGAENLVAGRPGGLAAGQLAEGASQGEVDAAQATGQGHQFARLDETIAMVKPQLEAGPSVIRRINLAVLIAIELG